MKAINKLSPRDESILKLRYQDDLYLSQIARKYSVSQQRVSQIIKRAIKKLMEVEING